MIVTWGEIQWEAAEPGRCGRPGAVLPSVLLSPAWTFFRASFLRRGGWLRAPGPRAFFRQRNFLLVKMGHRLTAIDPKTPVRGPPHLHEEPGQQPP